MIVCLFVVNMDEKPDFFLSSCGARVFWDIHIVKIDSIKKPRNVTERVTIGNVRDTL